MTENSISINKRAFQELFDLHFNALCAFGKRHIDDIFLVEDIVQEVFISFWHKREGFINKSAVKSYLYKSVRNKCLNSIRDEIVRQKQLQGFVPNEETYTDYVIEEEVFNQLYNEIKVLPKAAQEVMLLTLNGLKNQEIADELNISINTVKTQKKLAYAKLKSRISPGLHQVLLTL